MRKTVILIIAQDMKKKTTKIIYVIAFIKRVSIMKTDLHACSQYKQKKKTTAGIPATE